MQKGNRRANVARKRGPACAEPVTAGPSACTRAPGFFSAFGLATVAMSTSCASSPLSARVLQSSKTLPLRQRSLTQQANGPSGPSFDSMRWARGLG